MISNMAKRVAALYWDPETTTSAKKEDVPQKVKDLAEEVKDKNPGYDAGQAKATAWSVYCENVNPDSPHCKQKEYFEGKKSSVSSVVSPERIAVALRYVADSVLNSKHPSKSLVLRDLQCVKLAMDGFGFHEIRVRFAVDKDETSDVLQKLLWVNEAFKRV